MIDRLFIKACVGDKKMTEVNSISASINGINKSVAMHKYRQILILPKSTLDEFNIEACALKENVIISAPFDIHSLNSGTVLMLGSIKIRLTFLCEPCGKIGDIVSVKRIEFKRGYLAEVLESGFMNIGDEIKILEEKCDPIPYKLADRIKWYLDKCKDPVQVTELVIGIGLSKSYCRAIPNIIRNRTDIDKTKIFYSKNILLNKSLEN